MYKICDKHGKFWKNVLNLMKLDKSKLRKKQTHFYNITGITSCMEETFQQRIIKKQPNSVFLTMHEKKKITKMLIFFQNFHKIFISIKFVRDPELLIRQTNFNSHIRVYILGRLFFSYLLLGKLRRWKKVNQCKVLPNKASKKNILKIIQFPACFTVVWRFFRTGFSGR